MVFAFMGTHDSQHVKPVQVLFGYRMELLFQVTPCSKLPHFTLQKHLKMVRYMLFLADIFRLSICIT